MPNKEYNKLMEIEINPESIIKENKKPEVEIGDLQKSIESLEETIRITNSNKRVIWRGLLTGLSGVIGATIVFGIFLTFVSGILYSTGAFPELNELLNTITNKDK